MDGVRCPYCSYGGEFKLLKIWKFRFYEVKRLECPQVSRSIQPIPRSKLHRQEIGIRN
jgi:hypothetical protein